LSEKRLYWLKLKESFFTDKSVKKLRRMAGGDTYTVIYLKMLLRGLKNNGRIYYDGIEDTFADEIALELDEDADNVRFCMLYLEKCGLLEKVSETEAFLTETPSMTISESASAGRMRKLRERKTSQCDADVTQALRESDKKVTLDIEIDTDTDTDTETDTETDTRLLAQRRKTPSAPAEPAVYTLPCIKNEVYAVTQSQIDSWTEAYPAVDIDLALKQMIAWLDANPRKRKTRAGCPRFVNIWLGREQDSGKTPRRKGGESSAAALFDGYKTI
jgi:predicted phage replisome organizer